MKAVSYDEADVAMRRWAAVRDAASNAQTAWMSVRNACSRNSMMSSAVPSLHSHAKEASRLAECAIDEIYPAEFAVEEIREQ